MTAAKATVWALVAATIIIAGIATAQEDIGIRAILLVVSLIPAGPAILLGAANHDIHQWKQEHPSGRIPTLTHAQIDIWIYKNRRGRYDPANLYPVAKAIVDAYVTAGLLPDDNHEHLDGPHLHHGGFDKTSPGLLIVITPLHRQPEPPAHPQH